MSIEEAPNPRLATLPYRKSNDQRPKQAIAHSFRWGSFRITLRLLSRRMELILEDINDIDAA